MRKLWPFAVAVIVVGVLAGLAIAGRPAASDPFVLDPDITVAEPVSTTSTPAATTTSATVATTTTTAATTTVASTAVTTTTEAPTTTEAATSTAVTTTTVAAPLPRNQVRLVIANGDGRFRLASVTADRIRPLGYIVDLGDSLKPVDATIIYFRPGFDDEAQIVANDITVPGAIIAELPTRASQAITNSDDRGDVVLVLGPDAPR